MDNRIRTMDYWEDGIEGRDKSPVPSVWVQYPYNTTNVLTYNTS